MKKFLKRLLLCAGILVLAIVIALVALFWNELGSLGSLSKADDYPLYTMDYKGDYGFEEFLKVGASSDQDIERFVVKRLL